MAEVQLNPLQSNDKLSSEPHTRLQLTEGTLLDALIKDHPVVVWFLTAMGQLWPTTNWTIIGKISQYIWAGFVRIFLGWTLAYGIYFIIIFMYQTAESVYVFMGISIALQAAILMPTIHAMRMRLQSKCYEADLEFYRSSLLPSCAVFLFSLMCSYIFDVVSYCAAYGRLASCDGPLIQAFACFNFIGQTSVSCVLALNTLFVLVDSQVAVKLVKDLINAHAEKKMTIEMFNEYRGNIRNRVSSNYWTYNSVLFIAIANIVLMIVIAYLHVTGFILWPVIFIKEAPFVIIALYYSTTVNEQADKLSKLLGTTIWSSADIEEDHTRLFYFANAEAQKISFPLSGMRLKKRDLLLRVAASLLAFVLGLLRSSLEEH